MNVQVKLIQGLMNTFLLIYFAELVFPPITVFFNDAVIRLSCFIGWLGCSFILNPMFYIKIEKRVAWAFLFLIFTGMLPFLFGYSVIAHRYISLTLVSMGYVIYRFYNRNHLVDALKKIIYIELFLASITAVRTLLALLVNPFISRSIKSTGEDSLILASQGVGGYTFIYFIAACCIPLLYIFLNNNQKKRRYLCACIYLLFVIVILKASYMTALLTVVIGSSIIFLFSTSHARISKSVQAVIIIGIIGILGSGLQVILEFFKDILPIRITNVLYANTNQSMLASLWDELLTDRLPTLITSFNAFLEHPILGLLGGQGIDMSGEFLTGFGQHSYIMDTFALYGIFIGIFCLYIIGINFITSTYLGRQKKSLNFAMIVCVIMLYLFNNVTESIALVVGIIYPVVRDCNFNDKEA